ncbi:hypothetical protein [Burkholderia cepacia]|uniref:hypothetical protein n=1 Tax=Burkholderia cepacia TaxID=292 RepID=UPI000F596740|nr:hypothetical protein [Burkholderia cepacia]RQT86403.1 hypothetical protein DF041_29935 [Burkholderia cepacia]
MGNAKSVDLRFVNVAQVIDLLYADMLQSQYVIAPEVLADIHGAQALLEHGSITMTEHYVRKRGRTVLPTK